MYCQLRNNNNNIDVQENRLQEVVGAGFRQKKHKNLQSSAPRHGQALRPKINLSQKPGQVKRIQIVSSAANESAKPPERNKILRVLLRINKIQFVQAGHYYRVHGPEDQFGVRLQEEEEGESVLDLGRVGYHVLQYGRYLLFLAVEGDMSSRYQAGEYFSAAQ